MEYRFEGEVIYWRGPAPFLFAVVPEAVSTRIAAIAGRVSYGWGCIPVTAEIGEAEFSTSLFPRDGLYLLPLKVAARRKIGPVDVGDRIMVAMRIAEREGR